jgi:signal transduction histidine kinase
MASYRIKKQKILLDVRSSPASITGLWDAAALEQVFLNIILNSLDAMRDKGSIKIYSSLKDSQAVVEISDTGSGIPEKIRNKIFDPFFSTKSKEKGTGLGLSVSFKIIQEHMGNIELVSGPEKTGTTFAIRLPVSTG